jgi:hypothetical protein
MVIGGAVMPRTYSHWTRCARDLAAPPMSNHEGQMDLIATTTEFTVRTFVGVSVAVVSSAAFGAICAVLMSE